MNAEKPAGVRPIVFLSAAACAAASVWQYRLFGPHNLALTVSFHSLGLLLMYCVLRGQKLSAPRKAVGTFLIACALVATTIGAWRIGVERGLDVRWSEEQEMLLVQHRMWAEERFHGVELRWNWKDATYIAVGSVPTHGDLEDLRVFIDTIAGADRCNNVSVGPAREGRGIKGFWWRFWLAR